MCIYQKRPFKFMLKFFVFVNIIFIIMCFFGCAPKGTNADIDDKIDVVSSDIPIQGQEEGMDSDTWLSLGAEIRELNSISGMDEPVILVNGYPITKKEIETQKIYSKYLGKETLKESIDSLIRARVAKTEAMRLDIQPSREKIDAYLKQVDETLKNKAVGTETIFAYMEGAGITQEEYLSTLEETSYDMFQREALWESVKASQNDKDYEQYMDELVCNAEIEILDPEVEELLTK